MINRECLFFENEKKKKSAVPSVTTPTESPSLLLRSQPDATLNPLPSKVHAHTRTHTHFRAYNSYQLIILSLFLFLAITVVELVMYCLYILFFR